jgi:hypothetical protein
MFWGKSILDRRERVKDRNEETKDSPRRFCSTHIQHFHFDLFETGQALEKDISDRGGERRGYETHWKPCT